MINRKGLILWLLAVIAIVVSGCITAQTQAQRLSETIEDDTRFEMAHTSHIEHVQFIHYQDTWTGRCYLMTAIPAYSGFEGGFTMTAVGAESC